MLPYGKQKKPLTISFFCSEIFGKLLLSLEYRLLQSIKYIIKAVLKFW